MLVKVTCIKLAKNIVNLYICQIIRCTFVYNMYVINVTLSKVNFDKM